MLRSQYHTALHLSLRHTGQDSGKVEYEVAAGVRDDGEIGIFALRHFLRELYLKSLLIVVL